MNMAAMEYTKRAKRENNFFLCTSNKNLTAVDMLKAVVDDLQLTEKGIEMYSYNRGENVLVVFMADSPRHSEISMHKGTNALLSQYPQIIHFDALPRKKQMHKKFSNAEKGSDVYKSYEKLSFFKNGIYIRSVHSNFNQYLTLVKDSITKLTDDLYNLDVSLFPLNLENHPRFSIKPKVHVLQHLPEHILRFGCPIQYETESGEQFNKFIREHLFKTNHHFGSRDVAV
ncbi:hypothetical protein CU098_000457, partial [Rhizopus stolonifer]